MNKAELSQQLMITVNNKVGTLSEVTRIVAQSGINLIAVCAYTIDNKGFINFVADDSRRAKKLLEDHGYNVREEDIVLLTLNNKPGTLQGICDRIAEAGVDLVLIYGSVEQGQKSSCIVMVSENNEELLAVARTMK